MVFIFNWKKMIVKRLAGIKTSKRNSKDIGMV